MKMFNQTGTDLFVLCFSALAKMNHIDNTPNEEEKKNLGLLQKHILNPIMERFEITINSCFRCEKLNELVHGVKNSQHLEGKAVDILYYQGLTQLGLFIEQNLVFDQLINENNRWIHVSYDEGHNRKQILKGEINKKTNKMEYHHLISFC